MSIDNDLYLDASASRHALRDAIVQADVGLDAAPDWKHLSSATSVATDVTILDDLSYRSVRPDNGVIATRLVTFGFRKKGGDLKYWEEYDTQTVRGIVALLKAFPEADAYWVALDAEHPMLLRRNDELIISQRKAAPGYFWDPARKPSYLAMVDLPYTVAPLGPWNVIELPRPKRRRQAVDG